MDLKKIAGIFTTIAAITGAVVAVISVVVLVSGVNPQSAAEYIGAGIVLLLAFGTFKKSRICAVLLLGIYLYGRILMVKVSRHPITIFEPVAFAFFLSFLLGVAGTFLWHQQESKKKSA